jgi:hypothetical protein
VPRRSLPLPRLDTLEPLSQFITIGSSYYLVVAHRGERNVVVLVQSRTSMETGNRYECLSKYVPKVGSIVLRYKGSIIGKGYILTCLIEIQNHSCKKFIDVIVLRRSRLLTFFASPLGDDYVSH